MVVVTDERDGYILAGVGLSYTDGPSSGREGKKHGIILLGVTHHDDYHGHKGHKMIQYMS